MTGSVRTSSTVVAGPLRPQAVDNSTPVDDHRSIVVACGTRVRPPTSTARDILRLARRRRRLTQAELARRAGVETPSGGGPFPGPIGRRLWAHLGEILDVLEALGATDARLYGEVADGCEGVGSRALIGVSLPAQANPRPVMAASGRIGLLIDAEVHVLAHHPVVDYGGDGPGVALTSEATPPTRRSV